jgi:rRNA-processing protein CGR1
MSDVVESQTPAVPATSSVKGMKKNGDDPHWMCAELAANRIAGKQWHDNKAAFRPRANQSSWEKRTVERKALAAVKAKEKELREEKEAVKQVRVVTGRREFGSLKTATR